MHELSTAMMRSRSDAPLSTVEIIDFNDRKSFGMKISVNGEIKELPEGISVSEMIECLSLPSRRMAIEVNKQVIRKQDWAALKIKDGDHVEIVHFVGGG